MEVARGDVVGDVVPSGAFFFRDIVQRSLEKLQLNSREIGSSSGL